MKKMVEAAQNFVSFLNRAVTPFHAVDECSKLLLGAGFSELKEGEEWYIEPMKGYFVTKNKSALFSFIPGGKYKKGNGFSIISAHTDSPCLRVKPKSKITSAGCLQVGVTLYGGGLWRTWFDRDLTLGGRVVVKNGDKLTQKLVHFSEKPLLYIPSLAIHLETDDMRKSFAPNKEEHLKPILATQITEKLEESKPVSDEHHSILLEEISKKLQINCDQIVDFDLYLMDWQPATIGGIRDEFVSGARLDNLVGVYSGITGFLKSIEDGDSLINDSNVRMVAFYDNEECGSGSAQGAETSFTEWILRRISQEKFEMAVGRSYMVSADQAHAIHPNYRSRHEDNHQVSLNGGPVVKFNHNQRYATTSVTYAILAQIAQKAGVPLQKVCVRNDCPCGSTVGPILAAGLGIHTLDIGSPQWAMHSVRELMHVDSVGQAISLYKAFFENLPHVLANTEL